MKSQVMMRTKASSTGSVRLWRLGWGGHIRLVVAACALSTLISMHAEESKPTREHTATATGQQNLPAAKDEKTKVPNGIDSASCTISSGHPAIVTKTGEAAVPRESDEQDRMSKANYKAPSGDKLALPDPSRQEWGKDQIHFGAGTSLRDESRSETSEDSNAGSDLKCTPHEAAPKTEPAMPN
jgi:hypothetical protein